MQMQRSGTRERGYKESPLRTRARKQASEFYHPSCGCQIIPSELKRGIAEALGLEALCENRERRTNERMHVEAGARIFPAKYRKNPRDK
jgi:hypothetical protein